MALIPPLFLNSVVSIGINPQNQFQVLSNPEPQWIGTGFLFGRPVHDSNPRTYTVYLVTNKHVIANYTTIVMRFNTLQGNQTCDLNLNLIQNGNQLWIGHPDLNVDVAAIQIDPEILSKNGTVFNFFEPEQHCLSISQMKQIGTSEGDFIYVLGFPMGQVTSLNNYVISRLGSIARIKDLLNFNQKSFLIDANVYPGNSGGPVISKPEFTFIQGTQSNTSAHLLGMVKSYIPYNDTAVSTQTGRPRVIFEENSGLALVEPVDRIIETVDIAHRQFHPLTP